MASHHSVVEAASRRGDWLIVGTQQLGKGAGAVPQSGHQWHVAAAKSERRGAIPRAEEMSDACGAQVPSWLRRMIG
uniref:Uncharacterized protein n=1 Tax=Leersia perrieri TaxID=77586 RepID=A0A0D9XBE2_9ORYZ